MENFRRMNYAFKKKKKKKLVIDVGDERASVFQTNVTK